jgi:type IV pilus assembly protein PilN
MVYINLLPIKEIKQHAKAVQQLSIFAVCLVALLAVLAAVGFYQASTAASLEKDIKELNAEKQRYEKILAQIRKLEQDKKIIENKIAVINRLKKTSALTVHILDEIAKLTPTKRLWLTSLNQSGMNLSISGMALDNQTIASYMEVLKTSPYIADVNLLSSSMQQYAGRNLKSFSLSCAISLPAAADAEGNVQTQQ